MTLKEYQKATKAACEPQLDNFAYMIFGLVGKVGILANDMAELIRKEKIEIDCNEYRIRGKEFAKEQLRKMNKSELEEFANNMAYDAIIDMQMNDEVLKKHTGDILFQLSALCNKMGWDLEQIAEIGFNK